MKTHAVLLTSLFLIAGCTPPQGSHRANPIGTHDLVMVGEASDGGFVAALTRDGTGSVGVPSRYLFVTSADTNDLKVLENFKTGGTSRSFLGAPNPLETLSIPVLDRPTMLAADEGRNSEGSRVTGAYVYAARPGGSEISVVSIRRQRQLGGKPMATPAPVTAIGAFMEVNQAAPPLETPFPATTRVFVATWDGEFASVYAATLKTDSIDVDHLEYQRVVLIGQTPITAMLVVAPLPTRTSEGAPFCDSRPCLALATRSDSGLTGDSFLIDPQTGALAHLAFAGPVRDLVSSGDGARIYGILDEQACGGSPCGGVVAVDIAAAVASPMPPYLVSFPAALDALGIPMRPLRLGEGLITGLTLARGGSILQIFELPGTDGGSGGLSQTPRLQEFNELGAFASSTGVITFFSGLAGSVIDYDPRRASISGASVILPGPLPDGGEGFIGEDGGAIGSSTPATLIPDPFDVSETSRRATISASGANWRFDISDGYLNTQSIAFINRGQLPGLVALPLRAADGVRLITGGAEARAAVNDIVRFESGNETEGYRECGRSRIASIGSGSIDVLAVPAGCVNAVRFSVRADGLKPIVVAADLEGYMGRYAAGETLTYSRPYVLLTAGVTAPRPALTVIIPPAPPTNEGAITSFQIVGHLSAYQVTLDTIGVGPSLCYTQPATAAQVVMGNLVMDRVPTGATGGSVEFRWTLMGVVPSGNGLVEMSLPNAHLGAMTAADRTFCWR